MGTTHRFHKVGLAAIASIALVLATAVGGAAANQAVYNESGSAVFMSGGLGEGDEGHGDEPALENGVGGGFGYVEARQDKGEPGWLFAEVVHFDEVLCEGDPESPDDDYVAFVADGFYVYGEATLTVDRQLGSGVATASSAIVVSFMSNECTGEFDESFEGDTQVVFELTATGSTMRERGSSLFQIPGEVNERWTYRITLRPGAGMLVVGDDSYEIFDGLIGTTSWSNHGNG